MYAEIINNIIVSYSKTEMPGWIYTTTKWLCGWMVVTAINWDEIIAKIPDDVRLAQENVKLQQEKAVAINNIATITDQLNQLALIMEEMVLERETITPTMQKGLDMTNWIKAILNK